MNPLRFINIVIFGATDDFYMMLSKLTNRFSSRR